MSRWTTVAARPRRSMKPRSSSTSATEPWRPPAPPPQLAAAPAGAADRDREVGLALPLVRGQDEAEEVLQAAEQLAAGLVLEDELPHARVPSVKRPQRLHEVRVRQEAHVEYQIGIE